MPRNSVFFLVVLFFIFPVFIFSQQGAAALRDYVGLINQSYHPGIVSYWERVKTELARQNETDIVRIIDIILSGAFGSGFLYNDARGNLYVITNNHVVSQAHTLSITFERSDGTRRKVENLKIIAADEEADLAILALPKEGEMPFVRQGLTFLARQIEEGEDVYSAGFPGLGITPLWQFGRGMVSNSSARFPKSISDETLIGPFIQHTAQVDAGNSGGPLLAAQTNVPSNYAVVGINTLRAVTRQAANYAIPVSTVQAFINNALNPKPETFREELDQKLTKFIARINGKTSVYPHISEFLSVVCIGENAEYAFEEMLMKASNSVKKSFNDKLQNNFVGAMSIPIAWTIEEEIKSRGAYTAAIREITGAGEEYTVVFSINNKIVSSVWIREYGNWRVKTFGAAASGDTERITRRKADREAAANLRLRSALRLEAGYASLFAKAPAAFYASLEFLDFFGLKFYTAGSDFSDIGGYFNFSFPFTIGNNFGLIPFLRLGLDYQIDNEFEKNKKPFEFPISFISMAGLRITTSYVPGLFIGVGFQLNIINLHSFNPFDREDVYGNPMKAGLAITTGYSF